jgi:hypothetical protein
MNLQQSHNSIFHHYATDWLDSQFDNQLSNDICARSKINWNRNETTAVAVGRQCHFKIWLDCHILKKKNKSNFILI